MAQFLVELYVSRTGAAAIESACDSVRVAAEALTREGTRVRYLQSIFVPEDETCFLLCEAGSADGVREAAQRAGIVVERIAVALAQPRREEFSPCPSTSQ